MVGIAARVVGRREGMKEWFRLYGFGCGENGKDVAMSLRVGLLWFVWNEGMECHLGDNCPKPFIIPCISPIEVRYHACTPSYNAHITPTKPSFS